MMKPDDIEARLAGTLAHCLTDPKSLFLLVAPLDSEAQSAVRVLRSLGKDAFSATDVLDFPGFLQAGVHRFESARRPLGRRIGTLARIAERCPRVLVTSVAGAVRACPSLAWVRAHRFDLRKGESAEPDLLMEILEEYGYTRSQSVEGIGEYAVRGSILDFWTPGESHPCRAEFFGDSVERIRIFRPEDQRSFGERDHTLLLPSREFTWPKGPALEQVVDRFNGFLIRNGVSGTTRVELLESLRTQTPFPGIDDLGIHFADSGFESFIDIIKGEASRCGLTLRILLLGSENAFEQRLAEIEKTYTRAYDTAKNRSQAAVRFETVFPAATGFQLHLKDAEASPLVAPFLVPPEVLESLKQPRLAQRVRSLADLAKRGTLQRVLLLGRSEDSLLELMGIVASHLPQVEIPSNGMAAASFEPQWLTGTPPSGKVASFFTLALADTDGYFWIPGTSTLALSEMALRGAVHHDITEIFTDEETRSASREASVRLLSTQFSDFTESDLVVHVEHGIGRFCGLATVEVQGTSADFLVIEYANNDRIYVPVARMNIVQRYVGGGEERQLDSLRAGTWEKRRAKAKADAEKVAKELMEHQAKRAMTPGHAFNRPGEEYVEFEAAFPYDETPDQLRVIREILSDMGRPKAMDRLLVGDVGFGKTEVAMRAAYRCILDGKQVAWLVPTTVLAHQHYRSLQERFAPFGARVEILDRSSPRAGAKTLESLAANTTDIVVGTHRLLSKDVRFRDLGLLVVDEEHRFGVLQKEKIKTMSYGVDVLTMTATPIPRTLQMALTGLRELSLLTTPPKARLATKTFVCPFDESIIQESILSELSRGGQVFFVHNRVEELPGVLEFLKALVPKARIAVGHGKMQQKELDSIMIDFLDQKSDILLCTTIIESGIDMPNVNTIIVQNADHFGLAQLYQLRGRVGRRSTQGFAYFLTSPDIQENDDGMRRLEILREHQGLGSGFAIATHDLEMRGAGNVLGDEQSGRVSDVGLETYTQMLDEAIRRLGGIKVRAVIEPDISLPMPMLIPETYVTEPRERLRTYRRFFGTQSEEALLELIRECEDRFGPLPQEVQFLSEGARIRRWLVVVGGIHLKCGEAGTEVKLGPDLLQQEGDAHAEAVVRRILDLCNRRESGIRLLPDRLILPVRSRAFAQNPQQALSDLKRILSRLAGETIALTGHS